jgi:hypothetical protein
MKTRLKIVRAPIGRICKQLASPSILRIKNVLDVEAPSPVL